MPGFYWGIYREFFYLKISDTGMPSNNNDIASVLKEGIYMANACVAIW